jgi:hypothetical protein
MLGVATLAHAAESKLTGPVVTQLPAKSACAVNVLACTRLALDDARTTATVDEQRHEVRIYNDASYDSETIVADVLLHVQGGTRQPLKPYLVHLVVSKQGDKWKHRLSPYGLDKRRSDGPFQFEDWSVYLGQAKKPLMAPDLVRKAVGRSSLMGRAKDFFVKATDLRKREGDAPAIELGLGIGPLNFAMTRARFEVPASIKAGREVNVEQVMAQEDWFFEFQTLSKMVPAYLVHHDLFLFGLDRHPLVVESMKVGSKGNELMRVGVKNGKGYVQINERVEPYEQAPQTAVVFMRDTYLGMLLNAQVPVAPAASSASTSAPAAASAAR